MPSLKNLIENEYGAQSKLQGAAGQNYVNWAAKMAVEMGTGVSWVMCKEDDAPDLVDGLRITYFWIKEQIEKEKAQAMISKDLWAQNNLPATCSWPSPSHLFEKHLFVYPIGIVVSKFFRSFLE
ncbi:hypothetical protein GLYMA_09G101950v4 [Glycine max]|nr:hypothetical protein GLYMA_09G101950v4 [Glycine max]